jgi:hypothetical protein
MPRSFSFCAVIDREISYLGFELSRLIRRHFEPESRFYCFTGAYLHGGCVIFRRLCRDFTLGIGITKMQQLKQF